MYQNDPHGASIDNGLPPSLVYHYIVLIKDCAPQNMSTFMHISRTILGHHEAMGQIVRKLPIALFELFESQADQARVRIRGRRAYVITPLEFQYLRGLKIPTAWPLWVIIARAELIAEAETWSAKQTVPVLKLCIDENDMGWTQLSQVQPEELRKHARLVRRRLLSKNPLIADLMTMAMKFSTLSPPVEMSDPHSRHSHNCTEPNEAIGDWWNVGMEGQPGGRLGPDEGSYVRAIASSAGLVLRRRQQTSGNVSIDSGSAWSLPSAIDLILSAPSMHQLHLQGDGEYSAIATSEAGPDVAKLYRRIVKQRSYSLFSNIDESRWAMDVIARTPHAQIMVRDRDLELRLFTAVTTVLGANHLAPTLRLPYCINRMGEHLRRLGKSLRDPNPSTRNKSLRLYKRLSEEMTACVPAEFLPAIGESRSIKLISDAPVELLPVAGFPLFLRAVVSRMPAMPANLLFKHLLEKQIRVIPVSGATRCLVIRLLQPEEAIYRHLEEALCIWRDASGGEFPEYSIVDVTSVEQLIDVLRFCDHQIVIFDGHGAHPTDALDFGGLVIGGEMFDIWSLRGIVLMPPVVILSVCDTHPLDANHASIANGMLHLGAVSVLGTHLPIDARRAGIYVARLLYRIGAYLPEIAARSEAVRWSEVVSSVLRMNWVTDVLELLRGRGELSDWRELAATTTARINRHEADWLDRFVADLAAQLHRPVESTHRLLSDLVVETETIRYCHLGTPENVLIVDDDRVESLRTLLLTPNLRPSE